MKNLSIIIMASVMSISFVATVNAQDYDELIIESYTPVVLASPEPEDEPFVIVEEMPTFQGGDAYTFRMWIMDQLRYPQAAQHDGIQGRVVVAFVVERDGSISNVEILRTPDELLSNEVLRVMENVPAWTPGKNRSSLVRVRYTIPVEFRL